MDGLGEVGLARDRSYLLVGLSMLKINDGDTVINVGERLHGADLELLSRLRKGTTGLDGRDLGGVPVNLICN